MKIEYDPPKKRQPIFALFKLIIRPFVRRPRVVALGEKLQDGCMYIANHANKMGPMIYSMFLPVYHVKWGASQMLGSYKERFYYLRDVLYIQKNGSPHALASFRAFFEAFFSAFVYKGMKMLPTYPDGRLARTVKKTAELLARDIAVMIFPKIRKNELRGAAAKFLPRLSCSRQRPMQSSRAGIFPCGPYITTSASGSSSWARRSPSLRCPRRKRRTWQRSCACA